MTVTPVISEEWSVFILIELLWFHKMEKKYKNIRCIYMKRVIDVLNVS